MTFHYNDSYENVYRTCGRCNHPEALAWFADKRDDVEMAGCAECVRSKCNVGTYHGKGVDKRSGAMGGKGHGTGKGGKEGAKTGSNGTAGKNDNYTDEGTEEEGIYYRGKFYSFLTLAIFPEPEKPNISILLIQSSSSKSKTWPFLIIMLLFYRSIV